MATNCTVQARNHTLEATDAERARVTAEGVERNRAVALLRREWARTGEHGWTEKGRLHSFVGWWVAPGMVMEAKFSSRVAALGLGDVRVVGMPQQVGEYAHSPWAILVESIETGERGVFRTYSYDSHDCHVTAPSYMTCSEAFHAIRDHALSYADERFEY